MAVEISKLFNYKGKDVLIKKSRNKYCVGIGGKSKFPLWFENIQYNSAEDAVKYGKKYARIIIDKALLSKRKG